MILIMPYPMRMPYLDHLLAWVTEVQQEADQYVMDLVFEDGFSRAKFGQVPQEHDGSTPYFITLLEQRTSSWVRTQTQACAGALAL